MGIIGIALAVVGIIISIIVWIMKPDLVRRWIAQTRKSRVNSERIQTLASEGLVIENKELLADERSLSRKRFVYWPAVPTCAPGLIHVAFVHYIEDLCNAGLVIVLFVQDNYYRIIAGRTKKVAQREAAQFVRLIRRIGLGKQSHKVVYESHILRSRRASRSVLQSLLTYFGDVPKERVDAIAAYKRMMTDQMPFVRYMKPFLNMLYLSCSSPRFGFTLSGYDERPLWKSYQELVGDARKITLANLYIPTLKSITSGATDVFDKEQDITIVDSHLDVVVKIRTNLTHPDPEAGVFYVLKYIVFRKGYGLLARDGSGNMKSYNSVDKLIEDVSDQHVLDRESVVEALSEVIVALIRGNSLSTCKCLHLGNPGTQTLSPT